MISKLNELFKILGYHVEEYGVNRWKAKASGYRYLLIFKTDSNFKISAYLPAIDESGLRYKVENFLYKSGGFDIEKRTVKSLARDIKRRILEGYPEAINENLEMLFEYRKKRIEIKNIKSNVKSFLSSLGFTVDAEGDYIYKNGLDIRAYEGGNGLSYRVKLPILGHEEMVELAIFLSQKIR